MPHATHPNSNTHHLSFSLLVGCIVFVVLFGFGVGSLGFVSYRSGLYQQSDGYLADVLRLTRSQIDADDLAACIETLETSPSYDELQAYLDDIRETSRLDFIYVVLPLNAEPMNNMMDVIAGTSSYERRYMADQLTYLGHLTGDSYPPDVAQRYLERMENSDQVSFFANTTSFGHAYTGMLPIVDSHGTPVAVLAADLSLDGIDGELHRYVVRHILLTIVSCAISLVALYLWLRRRVVQPLEHIEESMRLFVQSAQTLDDPHDLVVRQPDVHTHDELESLADSLVATSETLRDSMERLIASSQEASAMRERARLMGELAYKDALTGIRNKSAYEQYCADLDKRIGGAESVPFAIAMLDVNGLKAVNDGYGHDKGDAYLRTCCQLICNVFQHSPVFRVGGDEFVVVLMGRDLAEVDELVARMLRPSPRRGPDDEAVPWETVDIAVGVAHFDPSVDGGVDDVFRRADQRMYRQKRLMKADRRQG